MDRVHVTRSAPTTLTVSVRGAAETVDFRSPAPMRLSGEVAALVAAPAALALGLPIETELEVAPGFRANFASATALLARWFPDRCAPVELLAEESSRPGPASGTIAFFTGGVDSFYTLLERGAEIDRLVFVHGADLRLEDRTLRDEVSEALRSAARVFEKPLVEVETTLRAFGDRYLDWGAHYHAIGLVSIAHLLGASRAIVPSSYHTEALFPWGSHPELDPLLGSDVLRVEHHGSDRHRTEKVLRVSKSEAALGHLRVCYKNLGGRYNCGECEKCLRTMITLLVAGALSRCATLPDEVSPRSVRSVDLRGPSAMAYARENRRMLRERGGHPDLARALAYAMARTRLRRWLRPVTAWIPGARALYRAARRTWG